MGSCIQPLGRRTGFRRNRSSHPGWGRGRVSSTVGNRNCNSWVSPHIISTLLLRFVKKLLLCLFTDRDTLRQSAQVTRPGSHSWHSWAKPSDNGGSTTPGSFLAGELVTTSAVSLLGCILGCLIQGRGRRESGGGGNSPSRDGLNDP